MSWPIVELGDISYLITKGTTPTTLGLEFAEIGVPFIRVQNLVDGAVSLDVDPLYISNDTHKKLKRSIIYPNDILVSIAGTIGRTAVVSSETAEMNCNQAVAIIRLKELINKKFFFHWMSSKDALGQIMNSKVTGTISNISLSQVGMLKIPLPPLQEQKRIAAILDQADALRRLRQRAIDRFNTLGQAIFYEMFGDPIFNPMNWKEGVSLGDASEIISGITKGRKIGGQPTREVPYLSVINVQDRKLVLEPLKTINATNKEIEKYRLKKNDILLTEGGDPDKLGRGTIWSDELAECIHQNHIFRVRLAGDYLRPVFLNWLIGSSRGKQYFLRSAKQTTGIASINMTQLKGFPLFLPPIEIQISFEEKIDALRITGDRMICAQSKTEAIFSSLQYRAFRGEL